MIYKFKELYNLYKEETNQERKNMIVDEFVGLCKGNPIWFNHGKDIEYIFDFFLPIVRERVIEITNMKLNSVVHHLESGDFEQAEELARKIAFHIPENDNDEFWFDAIVTSIRSVILALAEDVVSNKREEVDMASIVRFLESNQYVLDDFFNSRADNSLAKKTYRPLNFMAYETKNRVIGQAIISIKLKLQGVGE